MVIPLLANQDLTSMLVLSMCIVIFIYHVLQRSFDVICSECLIHSDQSLLCNKG